VTMARIGMGKKGFDGFFQTLAIKALSSLTATVVIWVIRSLIDILWIL